MPLAPTVRLANDVTMPALGLGTSPMDDATTERAVRTAIGAGYRLIDTAENYRNEEGVGRAIRTSGVDRDELFVTTKFNREWHGREEAKQAFANSSRRLGLARIDLLLIHWPNPQQDRYVDAWQGMIDLLEQGRVHAIGVSNFKPAHLERLVEATGVAPHVNQVQVNPHVTRPDERRFHADHGIVTESWSPLGADAELLGDDPIARIAERHGRTPAQVVLRWHLQLGAVPIPKSQDPDRQRQNLEVFDFSLNQEEMDAITALDRGGEGAADSDVVGH